MKPIKTSRAWSFGALFFFFTIFSPEAIGKTTNSPLYEDELTVREAINMAGPHDTVYLKNKTYKEHQIIIDKPLTLLGGPQTIIDAEEKGWIIKVVSDSVHINNVTLKNVGISHTHDQAALHFSRVSHFSVKNTTIHNGYFGILVEKSSEGIIANNIIKGMGTSEFYSGNGIHLWHCDNILVEKNEISGMRDGIYFEFVEQSSIYMNISQNNIRYGLHFMFSNNNEYTGNTFINNGAGVAVMFSKFIKMKKNTFSHNWGASSFGLLLKEIYDAEISGNMFYKNTVAIHVDGSSRIDYINNTFKQNGWAVKVTGGCYENIFMKNDFLSNSFDLSYNGKLNDNKFNGNYWSNYSGYDLNKDKVGDVPFRPVSLFSYVVNKTPETIILIRSLFVDILNFSEKVSPAFTPDNLMDEQPQMKPYYND